MTVHSTRWASVDQPDLPQFKTRHLKASQQTALGHARSIHRPRRTGIDICVPERKFSLIPKVSGVCRDAG